MHLFPAKLGVKYAAGHTEPPQNAKFPANVNDLDITSSVQHSDEVWGALNWVES